MGDEEPPRIDYQPAERPIHARMRRLKLPIAVVLFAASAYWWGPPLWLRVQVLYLQSRCADYEMPAGTVIASRPPVGIQSVSTTQSTAANQAVWFPPTPQVPPQWSRLYSLLSPPGLNSDGTVFLHMLRRPNGQRVLVAADFLKGQWSYDLQVRAFWPTRGINLPYALPSSGGGFHPDRQGQGFTIYAGQADPADPTHFIVKYRVGNLEYVIDGWVRDTFIDLEHRYPPTQLPPSSPD
jgi:hypothetical protein